MKKQIFTLLFVAGSSFLFAQQSFKMNLTEAIDYAVKNQPAFQNYRVDQQIASAKNLQSVSEYLPKLNGTFDLRDNLRLPIVALKFPNPITGADENLKIQQGTRYQGTTSADFSQPIIDGGAISDIKYAKQQIKLSGLQYEQALIDLKVNITRAYYLALLNQERVNRLKASQDRDQLAYDNTKVKYDNANALKTDVNRAYLNLQNTKYQMKVAQDSVKTAAFNLAQILGLPMEAKLELTDILPDQVKSPTLPEYLDVKAAEEARIELKAENQQKTLNYLQLNKTNFGYMPTLSGYASIGGGGLDNDKLFRKSSWYWSSYIGIKLSVPIFDGLGKMALAQQQKLALTKNENNLNSIRQTINYQLQSSSVNYGNTFENLQLIKENLKLAEDVLKDVNVRYQNSMAIYQEVVDAENTMKDTEFNYIQALYAYLMAELDWKKANGKI